MLDNFNDFYSPEIKRANIARCFGKSEFYAFRNRYLRREKVRKVFAENEFDAIVHLAAWAGVRPSLLNPKLYAEINVNGTLNLLDAAPDSASKQFVFASSSSVYGMILKFRFLKTTEFLRPFRPMPPPKRRVNFYVIHFHSLRHSCHGLFAIFSRYGARQRPDFGDS